LMHKQPSWGVGMRSMYQDTLKISKIYLDESRGGFLMMFKKRVPLGNETITPCLIRWS
jgi:hypothetical protein